MSTKINLKVFAVKYRKEILLGVAIIVILFLLGVIYSSDAELRQTVKENERLNAEVQRIDARMKEREIKFAQDSAEYEQVTRQYDTLIQDMTGEIVQKEHSVRAYIGKIKSLQVAAAEVKVASDTTEYVRKMDSAAVEFDNLTERYGQLEANMSELITMYSAKDSAQQRFIEILKAQQEKTKEAYLQVLDRYNILYKDFQQVAKKAKNRKKLNKILAGLVLGAGAAAILK